MSSKTNSAASDSKRSNILMTIASFGGAPFSRNEACAGSRSEAQYKAFAGLVSEGAVVSLGRRGNTPMFLERPQQGRVEAAIFRLAEQYLAALERQREGLASRLTPIPLSSLVKGATALPNSVRSALVDAVARQRAAGKIFVLKIARRDYFLFASDLRCALDAASSSTPAEPSTTAPSSVASSVDERIVSTYWTLRRITGLRNVPISDILERSGVDRFALHDFLNRARHARRANATLGEPTAATPKQLAAALPIEGRPHIYIELFEGAAP